jgi:hypothetical protein
MFQPATNDGLQPRWVNQTMGNTVNLTWPAGHHDAHVAGRLTETAANFQQKSLASDQQ